MFRRWNKPHHASEVTVKDGEISETYEWLTAPHGLIGRAMADAVKTAHRQGVRFYGYIRYSNGAPFIAYNLTAVGKPEVVNALGKTLDAIVTSRKVN